MSTLYQLADELREALEEHVDPETGEITDAGLEALAKVEMAFEKKALNVASYVISLKAKADGYKGEAESVMSHATALKRREQACKNEAQRLLDYLQMHLEDGQKLEDNRVRIGWGTATSVVLKETVKPEHMPLWALKTRPPEADKTKLKEALNDPERAEEAGEFAYIAKRRYVRLR